MDTIHELAMRLAQTEIALAELREDYEAKELDEWNARKRAEWLEEDRDAFVHLFKARHDRAERAEAEIDMFERANHAWWEKARAQRKEMRELREENARLYELLRRHIDLNAGTLDTDEERQLREDTRDAWKMRAEKAWEQMDADMQRNIETNNPLLRRAERAEAKLQEWENVFNAFGDTNPPHVEASEVLKGRDEDKRRANDAEQRAQRAEAALQVRLTGMDFDLWVSELRDTWSAMQPVLEARQIPHRANTEKMGRLLQKNSIQEVRESEGDRIRSALASAPAAPDRREIFYRLANYESDEPYDDGDDQPKFSLSRYVLDQWLAQDHYGDCTNVPVTCSRCFAERCWHKAGWIAAAPQRGENDE